MFLEQKKIENLSLLILFVIFIYFDNKSMKKKMNYANKQNVPYVIIIGEDEVAQNKVTVKNMITGEQELKNIDEI